MRRRYKILNLALGIVVVAIAAGMLVLSHDSPCAPVSASRGESSAMRAMVYRCYGSPDVIRQESVAKPAAAPGRVLVRVAAASVNPLDWHYLKGEPYFVRAMIGVGSPEDVRLGVDYAGTVEAVGPGVDRFKVGDEVFGGAAGAFAEYVTVREGGSIARKPPNVTFEQAAAVPIAAVTALQALRDAGQLQPGQHVLINGASGGVGTFAVQIARQMGAKVTGVCSTRNLAMVREIGAEEVIDYTHEDFTRRGNRYDLIIDNIGNHSQFEYRRILKPTGRAVIVGGIDCGVCLGPLLTWIGRLVVTPLVSQKQVGILASLEQKDLEILADWLGQGRIRAVIDRTYPLSGVPAALAYLEQGHARGKVVITLSPENAQLPALPPSPPRSSAGNDSARVAPGRAGLL
jgi:NADPH:quinone reductase-like Zn-dependent oxidoreductase